MPGWWNSIDAVSRFNLWTQVAIAVFGVLAAIATVLSVAGSKRLSVLQSQEADTLQARLRAAESASAQIYEQLKVTIRERHAAEARLAQELEKARSTADGAARQLAAEKEAKARAEEIRRTPPRLDATLTLHRR